MIMKLLTGFAIGLFSVSFAAGSASAGIIYSTDFESGVDAEWFSGSTSTSYTDDFTNFLGRFGNNTATLQLTGLGNVTSTVTLDFDFYAIDSWDGDNARWGTDYFGISGDYDAEWFVRNSTFGGTDSFPYAVTETGHFGYRTHWQDDIYRSISISFEHTGDNLSLSFYGSGLQSLNDESWGIDNLSVSTAPVPEPATMFLFGTGLMGLVGSSILRKKKK